MEEEKKVIGDILEIITTAEEQDILNAINNNVPMTNNDIAHLILVVRKKVVDIFSADCCKKFKLESENAKLKEELLKLYRKINERELQNCFIDDGRSNRNKAALNL